jgi:predicted Zn-dependent protease
MEDIAESAEDLALKNGCAYAEARVRRGFGDTAIMKNGNLEAVAYVRQIWIGVRVINRGALGFPRPTGWTGEACRVWWNRQSL